MTTILWTNGQLMADSRMWKGREQFDSLSKIVKLDPPLTITSQFNEDWNDTLVGYAASGSVEGAAALMKIARKQTEDHFDRLQVFYNFACEAALSNDDNDIIMIIVGKKRNYTIDLKRDFFTIEARPHEMHLSIGAGRSVLMDWLTAQAEKGYVVDPIKGFYHVFYAHPQTCGGHIDIWKLNDEHDTKSFFRFGIVQERPLDELPFFLAGQSKPLTVDLTTGDALEDQMVDIMTDKLLHLNPAQFEKMRQKRLAAKEQQTLTLTNEDISADVFPSPGRRKRTATSPKKGSKAK